MKMNALVMSRNTSAVRALVTAFAELGMEYQISLSPSETMELVASGQHSALIVDFDMPHSIEVARMARIVPTRRKPVLFGMIGSGTPIASVFQSGGNFVLYKPLDLLQVLHSLRAAQSFMKEDRRGSSRQKSETLAYLQLPAGTIPALVQDLTEQGLSVQAAEPLMLLRSVPLRFLLPGTTNVVKATGDFIWADKAAGQGCSLQRCRWHAVVIFRLGCASAKRRSRIQSECCWSRRRAVVRRSGHTDWAGVAGWAAYHSAPEL